MKSKLLILSTALIFSSVLGANEINIGLTYPIMEPDTRNEIKRKAGSVDWKSWMRKEPAQYTAFQGAKLPKTTADSTRLVDPTYALERDITDENGRIIFQKGTKVNLLERAKFTGRFIIIGGYPEEISWLETLNITDSDRIILAGNRLYSDAIKESEFTFLLLSERMIDRFDLRSAPAIVQQKGPMYEVTAHAVF